MRLAKPLVMVLFVATLTVAAVLRLPALERRPVHADEAVHMYKFNELWTTGQYRYDPVEYHGPTLYYATLPVAAARGVRDWRDTSAGDYRVVTALFGIGLVALAWLVRGGIGHAGALCAAAMTALSPALTFYSRYYIQETLLVFFTFAVIVAGWCWTRSRRAAWAVLAGVGLGCMHATKETCIIAWFALAIATLVLRVFRGSGARNPGTLAPRANIIAAVLLALGTAFVTSVLLISAAFTDPAGPFRAVLAYAHYLPRAAGAMHQQPWYYYLQLLAFWHPAAGPVWSEWPILVFAVFGAFAAWRGAVAPDASAAFARWLVVYVAVLSVVYASIPYKTPWCVLGPLHGAILLAGIGAGYVWHLATRAHRAATRVVASTLMAVALVAAFSDLGRQAWRSRSRFAADARNPWVYAHTVPDVQNLTARLEQLAAVHPRGHDLLLPVLVANPWPLPWYLRAFPNAGYWDEIPDAATIRGLDTADVVLVGDDLLDGLAQRWQMKDEAVASAFGLRPDEVVWLHVRRALWVAYLDRFARAPYTASQP